MNDKRIETDFEKLKEYLDIDTYYDELSEFKNLLYEVFGDRVESQKYIVRTNKKLEQLESNWNSLKEYAKDEFKKYPDGFITSIVEKYNDCFTSDYTDFDKHSIILNILKEKDKVILDKMNELERKYKDGK